MKISRGFLVDLVERVAATYVEAFVGLLLAGPSIDLSTAHAALIAAFPAALAVAKGGLATLTGDRDSAGVAQ